MNIQVGYPTPASPPQVPPKIQAAMAYISFCQTITAGYASAEVGKEDKSRKLASNEQRCYDAAISSMTEYFNTDGWGDEPPSPPGDGNQPHEPKVPVKVP